MWYTVDKRYHQLWCKYSDQFIIVRGIIMKYSIEGKGRYGSFR